MPKSNNKKTVNKQAIEQRESLDKDYSLWVLLNQARDSMHKAREKELAQYGISSSQAAVLFISKMIDCEVTPSEISRWLLKEPHTVSAIISRMERQGLLKKIKGKGKNNSINIALTKAGEEAYLNSEKIQSIKDITSHLTVEEGKQLRSLLARLRDISIDYTSRFKVPFPRSS
jgi:DNA-binding MarR family transcriptional regulator